MPPSQGASLSPSLLRGLLIVVWRQGLRRRGRWHFWRQLVLLLLRRRRALPDYVWLLLIEEHMLRYREVVHQQVQAQLASPLLQGQSTAQLGIRPNTMAV